MDEIIADITSRAYVVPNGMARSVFENKYSRKSDDGTFQSWSERVEDVILGNFLLDPRLNTTGHALEECTREHTRTQELAVAGVFPTSGRHLQHGDIDQPTKLLEMFSNCATAMFSFMVLRLLLRGAGVGRDYSAACCRVDWSNMPDVRLVLDASHPDFEASRFEGAFESLRDARHKYDSESERVRWFKVEDTREGWSKIVEILETAAWQEKHADKLFIFDFSALRPKGAPIMGLQGRPASGPIPLMDAIARVASIKTAGMKPWKQAMFIDHYLAACVHLGGARRSARMAVKSWRDRDVVEFIDIKRGGFLWSANNSLTVDAEFWEDARQPRHTHGRRVFEAAVNAAYWDGTGEPGFINVDKLNNNLEGLETITGESYISTKVYKDLHRRTRDMIDNVLEHVKKLKYPFIVNPCQPAFAPVLTPSGISSIGEIKIGDRIWSKDGWVEVTNKQRTGVKPVHRYRTTAGVFYGTEEHRIVQNGEKVQVCEAESIDRLNGPVSTILGWNPNVVMDGLVIGDGSTHRESVYQVYLTIGENDEDYFDSEIGHLIIGDHAVKYGLSYKVHTSITLDEMPVLPERFIPPRYIHTDQNTMMSFLRGLYSANGTVVKAGTTFRITLKTTSPVLVEQVQIMLSSVGIPSFFTTNKATDITWKNGTYKSKESYDVNITGRYGSAFAESIGFVQKYKQKKLMDAISGIQKNNRGVKNSYEIREVTPLGDMDVYDITVSGDSHTYWSGGCDVSNCGEIALSIWGGLCVIGDTCLAQAITKREALDAVGLMSRFLIRCNLMQCDYAAEIKRTNRIGVSLTGIHEFAWNVFGLTFQDMIDYWDFAFAPMADYNGRYPPVPTMHPAHNFWTFVEDMRRHAEDESEIFSEMVGLPTPHTVTTVKPSGCRPATALTTTDAGILTLEELMVDHPEAMTWADYTGKAAVIREDGNFPISKTYKNGVQPVYRITMNYGLSVESTGEHPWWITERVTEPIRKDGSTTRRQNIDAWVNTVDVRVNDVLQVNLGVYQQDKHSILTDIDVSKLHGGAVNIRQPTHMDERLAWFLGYLWGNGNLSASKWRVRFSSQYKEHIEKCQRLIMDLFDLYVDIKPASEGRDAWVLDCASHALWDWIHANGFVKYDFDQMALIPVNVRSSATVDIIAFLAGLIDSDGCVSTVGEYKRTLHWTSADTRFAKHVQDVAWSVGLGFGRSHNTKGNNLQTEKSMWLCSLSAHVTEHAFDVLEHNCEKIKHSDHTLPFAFERGAKNRGVAGKVLKIELVGEMPTFDVEIAGEPWFYAGAVKSHNTISKVMACTEGVHLPALTHYLRWVQYQDDDPAVDDLKTRGYPVQDMSRKYPRQVIVGFPTKQPIVDLMGDHVVTADEVSVEDNFKWLMLLEKFWLGDAHRNNQISYTLKYDANKVSYPEFMEMILKWQPLVRCCAVMPQSDWRESAKIYGYVPEQPITANEYETLMGRITAPVEREAYDDENLQCSTGICPIEPDR